MKFVLIPLSILRLAENTIAPVHFARETYIQCLIDLGLVPMFVSSVESEEMVAQKYDMAAGVLCMGGTDFDSSHYTSDRHEKTDSKEYQRDILELSILRMVLRDKKPFLGICRGCQALAIASGGSLHQHIPDFISDEEHGIGEGKGYDHLVTNTKHVVLVDTNSKLFSLVQKDMIFVNSGHHQSVNSVGENLTIAAKSPGGVVEVIEHVDPTYFCYGVQCHPETDFNGDLSSLFTAFAQAVIEY